MLFILSKSKKLVTTKKNNNLAIGELEKYQVNITRILNILY